MEAVLMGFAGLCWITSVVCWIIVLVKIFQNNETVMGVIGILCGLVAFVMGWVRSGEWGIQKVMLIWTASIIGSIVIQVILAIVVGAGLS